MLVLCVFMAFANVLLIVLEIVMAGVRRTVNIVYIPVPFREYPHQEGSVQLGHGYQEIFVSTLQQPERVWLSFEHHEGVQCCLGQIDTLSSYSTPDGFVVIANINSESAEVKWIADFV